MAKRRAQRAPLGLTSNGLVLMNALELLPPRTLERLRAALGGVADDWFLGLPLEPREATLALTRIDDAAAEIVAKSRAGRRVKAARKRTRA
jgi:hypothetical protein